MAPALLLLGVLLLYGVWAVGMKVVGEHVSVPWAMLLSLCVYIPIDAFLMRKLTWPPPAPKYIVWAVVMLACGAGANLCYLAAAKHFSGSVLTAVSALYPLIALPIFIAMGERPGLKQLVGALLSVAGAWLLVA